MKSIGAVLVLCGVLVGSASRVHALDMCFNTGLDSQTIVVAKNYSRPAKGGCKPLTGFEVSGSHMISGTVCLNAAGDTLHVAYTVHPHRSGFSLKGPRWGQIDLAYPSLASGQAAEQDPSGGLAGTSGSFGGRCFFPQPIP